MLKKNSAGDLSVCNLVGGESCVASRCFLRTIYILVCLNLTSSITFKARQCISAQRCQPGQGLLFQMKQVVIRSNESICMSIVVRCANPLQELFISFER